ncbi:PVC-type heme-binding CxxCH protein [Planctomicrobium sp. SH664]|uniref:PVC-type heme-binding CxxCH protein n=1 Tax=Planctomicrobium sp. SH664 TaxID=3448125 RepID=UPI003F5C5609
MSNTVSSLKDLVSRSVLSKVPGRSGGRAGGLARCLVCLTCWTAIAFCGAAAAAEDQKSASQPRQVAASEHDVSKTGGTAPLTPEESIAAMSVRDGFRVEVVAAEPLVVDPVAIDFGPDGKLWVAEMRDYPQGVPGVEGPGGVVRFLEDTDGDGHYDRSTLFLEGIPFPTGVTAWKNGVLICSAPDVLYAEDTDGDGRADVREVVLSGFETHNYQARVNSLSPGLDNWMYGAAGIFGGKISTPGNKPVDARNRDFRFRPDQKVVEAVSGRTQQGRARNDWGDWFGCSNEVLLMSYPTSQYSSARSPLLPVPPQEVNLVSDPKLYPSGKLVQFEKSGPAGFPTSVCGLDIYRDSLLGEEFSGNAFVCEPVNQLVHRRLLLPEGATFKAVRAPGEETSEFLASADSWFRPVQVRTGPDGALYVVDMYRYVIEHPKFISEDVKANLDIRAGDSRGRIYRVLPVGTSARKIPNVRALSDTELVATLDTPNGTLRDQAHLELLRRDAQGVAGNLKQLAAQGTTPQGRVHALCVLEGLKQLDATTIVNVLEAEQHPGVVRNALRVSENLFNSDPRLAAAWGRFVHSQDLPVRLQLAFSLGAARSPGTTPILSELLKTVGEDRYLQQAALSSLTAANIGPVLKDLSQQGLSLESMRPVILAAAEIAPPEVLQPVLEQQLNSASAADPTGRLKLAITVRQTWKRRQVQPGPADAAFWNSVLNQCSELSLDSATPTDVRIVAIAAFPLDSDSARGIAGLAECLQPQQPQGVQEAAIRGLASMKAEQAQSLLFDSLRGLAPSVQAFALNEICAHQNLTVELLRRLEDQSIPRTLIDSTRKQKLTSSPNAEIRRRAEGLFAQPSNTEVATQLMEARRADLANGNSALGKELFTKHCAACHRAEGLGRDVGPDLDSITDRSKDFLVTSILDPNAAVDRRYATYSAVLTDGRVYTGILTSESENSISLKEAEGVKRDIPRSEIESLIDTGKSLMPEGLSRELGLEDLRNLLAFLKATRLDGAPGVAGRPVEARFASVREAAVLMSQVQIGTQDEYRLIPQVFQVSIAAGKRNDAGEIKAILEFALPGPGEPLRDWEAVVVGGGIINGISLSHVWPARRIQEILGEDESLNERWQRTLELAKVMCDDEKVEVGTRYDALRIVAMLPFAESRALLEHYLKPGTNHDLIQGAVSGLADVPDPEAAVLLVKAYGHIPKGLLSFAQNGLARPDGGRVYLLDALDTHAIAASQVPVSVVRKLLNHDSEAIRSQAARHFTLPK